MARLESLVASLAPVVTRREYESIVLGALFRFDPFRSLTPYCGRIWQGFSEILDFGERVRISCPTGGMFTV